MKKRENGITLIALIITIIIMLILVSVSINILIKSDLFGAAQNAADKTKTAYEEEGIAKKINLVIGATIDYKEYIDPSTGEAFTTMPSYTSYATTRGTSDFNIDSSDATYTIAEPAEGETGIEWVVIGEEDGKIKIKTKNVVTTSTGGKELYFRGQAGYANFVNELNNIGAIYGKGKYAVEGRSLKMEDLWYGELTREAGYIYANHADLKIYQYDVTATEDDIANETSKTGGTYSTFKYMAMDADPNLKEGDEGAYEWKELYLGDYITMYQYTYTYTGNKTLSTIQANACTSYWLASRSLGWGDDSVWFCACSLQCIYPTRIEFWNSSAPLYTSTGCDSYSSDGVCAVVFLESDIQLKYNEETNSYTIVD